MLRSLYSGVSGMRGFQTKMDVIANNIANANTTAYKSSRSRFQDVISQTTASAQAASATGLGGVNARQIGLGMKVGAIDAIMTGGNLQPTNRELDFAIEKEGFFIVSPNHSDDGDNDNRVIYYTRDGGFYKDSMGNIVNANGEKVLGLVFDDTTLEDFEADDGLINNESALSGIKIPNNLDPDDPDSPQLESWSVDGTGLVTAIYGEDTYVLGKLAVAKFSNPEGLMKAGSNNYQVSNNSGEAQWGSAGGDGYGNIRQGFLEMSNVDLANEFTEMIIASRAYSANSRSITTSDEMLQELINLKR